MLPQSQRGAPAAQHTRGQGSREIGTAALPGRRWGQLTMLREGCSIRHLWVFLQNQVILLTLGKQGQLYQRGLGRHLPSIIWGAALSLSLLSYRCPLPKNVSGIRSLPLHIHCQPPVPVPCRVTPESSPPAQGGHTTTHTPDPGVGTPPPAHQIQPAGQERCLHF